VAGKFVSPTLPLLLRSLAAQSNSIFYLVRVVTSVLYGVTLSFSHLNLLNVTQIYVSTTYFFLKQGYIFRLEVSHLQAPTTFSLPDALPILGSHNGQSIW